MSKIVKDEVKQTEEPNVKEIEDLEATEVEQEPLKFNKQTISLFISQRIGEIAIHAEQMRKNEDYNGAVIEGRAISELAYILGEIALLN